MVNQYKGSFRLETSCILTASTILSFPLQGSMKAMSQVSAFVGKMLVHLCSHAGWWVTDGARGRGSRQHLQSYTSLFLLEDQVPDSFCLACPKLFAESEGLDYPPKGQLKRKSVPLNTTISFSLLPHCPYNISCVSRQFPFLPLCKKFSSLSALL